MSLKIAADTPSVQYFWFALYLITIPSFSTGRFTGFFPAGGGAVHGVPAASACAGGAAGWRFAGAGAVLCGIGDAVPAPVGAAGRKRSGADVLIRNRILGGKPLLVSG